MARYDDGGIEFSEQKFAAAREYREDQAKKQEEFSKELGLGNFLVKAINFGLDKRADNLENEKVVENAWYQNQLETAKKTQERIAGYEALGYTRKEMYEADIRQKLEEYINEDENIRYTNVQDGINEIVNQFTTNKDTTSFEAWNKSIEAQLNIPNITKEDLITAIKNDADVGARNIGELFGNQVFKISKSHDKETLEQADKNAKGKIVGSLLGDKFEVARESLKEYAATGSPILELKAWMLENEEHIVGFDKSTVQAQIINRENPIDNTIETVQIFTAIGENNEPFTLKELVMSSQPQPPKLFSHDKNQLLLASGEIRNQFQGTPYEDFIADNYNTMEQLQALSDHVLTIEKQILKSGRVSNSKVAFEIAAKHVVKSLADGRQTYGTIFLHQIDSINNEADDEKIGEYIDSIQKEIKGKHSQRLEIQELTLSIVQEIKAAKDRSEDEKVQDILNIDRILTSKNLPTIEQMAKVDKASQKEGSPEATFYEDLKDHEVVGSIAEFMFGDEIDMTDAFWLIPGAGLLKIGGKVLVKTMGPQISKILLNKYSTKFFDKLNSKKFNPKTLNKIERAMYNSLSPSKKSINHNKFFDELLKIPGVAVKGMNFGNNKVLYGGTAIAVGKSFYEDSGD